jgi:transcriptional regulator with XRE-family HTH domain
MSGMATKKRQPEKRLPVPSDFGEKLKELLKAKGITLSEFSALIGEDLGHVHRVCNAKRNPPNQGLDKWAAALRLTPAETDDFLDAGYLTACPEYIKVKYRLLKAAFLSANNR